MSTVTGAIFREGQVVSRVALDESMPQEGRTSFIWIEVVDPTDSDFDVLQGRFHLHNLAVEDSMTPAQSPKVDLYDSQIFVVLKKACLENDRIHYTEMDAFVSRHHIITVHHGGDAEYTRVMDKFQSGPRATRLGPDFILHRIMDFVVSSYFPVLEMIEDEVLAMEQRLLDQFLEREEITRLFQLRREVTRFQHMLSMMSDVCSKLTNLDVPCISAEVKPYFRDVHDHLARLDSSIRGLADVIRSVYAASNLLEQQRQGIITRQLAAWAAILGVLTAIAGVYGMNFSNMPELQAPYGYPVAMGVMLAICLTLFFRFKKLRWL
jgi:magnesium transporter